MSYRKSMKIKSRYSTNIGNSEKIRQLKMVYLNAI